jgi:hypothetical protein
MCIVTATVPTAKQSPPQETGVRKRTVAAQTSTPQKVEHTEDDLSNVDIVATFENVQASEIWKYFCKSSLATDFFDTSKPWVLVPNGSFMGNFGWVPARFRIGPWHSACSAYLVALTILVAYECYTGFTAEEYATQTFQSFPAWTLSWYYNVVGFAWTSFIVYKIFCSGMGWTSWGMYTVWSWTLIMIRHGLCAAVPFKPEWLSLNEWMRFPTLVMATLTFGVWNAVIGPSIYAQMKTPAMKESFCRFFGNSLWRQLHVYNIIYASINGIWGSPARSLIKADFSIGLGICLLYAFFYLFFLDRLGVHYYLVFSPRTTFALISWTVVFGLYYACFPLWNTILTKFA